MTSDRYRAPFGTRLPALMVMALLAPLFVVLTALPAAASHPVCSADVVDDDGDGWAWQGTWPDGYSCEMPATSAASPAPVDSGSANPVCSADVVDDDGDGWAWQGTWPDGYSCEMAPAPSSRAPVTVQQFLPPPYINPGLLGPEMIIIPGQVTIPNRDGETYNPLLPPNRDDDLSLEDLWDTYEEMRDFTAWVVDQLEAVGDSLVDSWNVLFPGPAQPTPLPAPNAEARPHLYVGATPGVQAVLDSAARSAWSHAEPYGRDVGRVIGPHGAVAVVEYITHFEDHGDRNSTTTTMGLFFDEQHRVVAVQEHTVNRTGSRVHWAEVHEHIGAREVGDNMFAEIPGQSFARNFDEQPAPPVPVSPPSVVDVPTIAIPEGWYLHHTPGDLPVLVPEVDSPDAWYDSDAIGLLLDIPEGWFLHQTPGNPPVIAPVVDMPDAWYDNVTTPIFDNWDWDWDWDDIFN